MQRLWLPPKVFKTVYQESLGTRLVGGLSIHDDPFLPVPCLDSTILCPADRSQFLPCFLGVKAPQLWLIGAVGKIGGQLRYHSVPPGLAELRVAMRVIFVRQWCGGGVAQHLVSRNPKGRTEHVHRNRRGRFLRRQPGSSIELTQQCPRRLQSSSSHATSSGATAEGAKVTKERQVGRVVILSTGPVGVFPSVKEHRVLVEVIKVAASGGVPASCFPLPRLTRLEPLSPFLPTSRAY